MWREKKHCGSKGRRMFHGGRICIFKFCREIKARGIGNWRTHGSLIILETEDDLGMLGVGSFRRSRRMSDW